MKDYKFIVTGMTCAACQANVEKASKSVEGVIEAQVNLLTDELIVSLNEEQATPESIISAINKIGYGAKLFTDVDSNRSLKVQWEQRQKREEEKEKSMKKRLFSSIIILIVLMYIAMGGMVGLPLPQVLKADFNPLINAVVQMLLALPVLFINRKFFISGFKGFVKRAANMDTLVALGSGASFLYGVFVIFIIAKAISDNNTNELHNYAHQLYFESSAMILTLVTVGKFLEARSKRKTGDALGKLVELSPKTATLIKDNIEITIPAEDVKTGDVILIRPGERIPVDGILTDGNSFVDQSAVTGESLPVEKNAGDEIISATLNKNGTFKMTATKVGENTTISQIIRLVDKAGADKAPIARLADKVSGVFVPVVMVIALITLIVWLVLGSNAENAISFAVTVLVISCPCALGLATPVAIMAGTGKAAENGILIKNATALEALQGVDEIYLDKTGTVTSGEMAVSDIILINNTLTEAEFIKIAAALESGSEHPLGKAVRNKAENLTLPQVTKFAAHQGKGVSGVIDNSPYLCGNERFLNEYNISCTDIKNLLLTLSAQGKTPLILAKNSEIEGVIGISDVIRADSKNAIEALKKSGKKVVMLTGDNKNAAEYIGTQAGIDEIIAELLPQDKEKVIREAQQNGKKIAFIGDGINDAPALTRADIGIAIGAGTDIAIDSADIVLIKNTLADAVTALMLSKAVIRNIKINLFWAFFYNALGIPLAAGVFYPLWGIKLTPMIGSAAMSLSSLCVVTNALRLRFFKSRFISEKKEITQNEALQQPETPQSCTLCNTDKTKGSNNMTKTFKVEGMMCPRCEAHVVKALKAIDGVEDACASHQEATATVTLAKDIADETLISAIVEEGYEVVES